MIIRLLLLTLLSFSLRDLAMYLTMKCLIEAGRHLATNRE